MNDSQRQSLSHAIKAVLNDVKEFDVKFKHPFNQICTGPSQSGKSCFVKTLLHKRQIEHQNVQDIQYIYNGCCQ